MYSKSRILLCHINLALLRFVCVCYSLLVKLSSTIIRLISDNVSIDFTSGSEQLSNIDNER